MSGGALLWLLRRVFWPWPEIADLKHKIETSRYS
jgi:hypothetical protein